MHWDVPVALSAEEKRLCKDLSRVGKFFVFLRQVRHRLFDEAFEAELAVAYGKARGTKPVPPALLAMVWLLQAYDKVGDANAVVTARMDLRWQLVLGCVGATKAPFSQGVLVAFRERMIAHDLDKRLVDRTVELAKETGLFGWKNLRVALDSSPLLGAGRVEDSWNLVGRALSTVTTCAAAALGVDREEIVREAGLSLLRGPSLKAALDIDWDSPEEQRSALQRLMSEVEALEAWVKEHVDEKVMEKPLVEALEALHRILEQDFEPDPSGGGSRIRKGTARDRMPSLGDPEMRHGRKSRSHRFNGYKRHTIRLVGCDLLLDALVVPANHAEHVVAGPLLEAAGTHGAVTETLIDRGYLAAEAIRAHHDAGGKVVCKPWPSRNAGRYTKEDFEIDLDRASVRCPAGHEADIRQSLEAHFPKSQCAPCALRSRCTTATSRSVTIHPQEKLLLELRKRKRTPEGRAELRERVVVEHSNARLAALQGTKARYKGARKNTMDARRCVILNNLQALQRDGRLQPRAAA